MLIPVLVMLFIEMLNYRNRSTDFFGRPLYIVFEYSLCIFTGLPKKCWYLRQFFLRIKDLETWTINLLTLVNSRDSMGSARLTGDAFLQPGWLTGATEMCFDRAYESQLHSLIFYFNLHTHIMRIILITAAFPTRALDHSNLTWIKLYFCESKISIYRRQYWRQYLTETDRHSDC